MQHVRIQKRKLHSSNLIVRYYNDGAHINQQKLNFWQNTKFVKKSVVGADIFFLCL